MLSVSFSLRDRGVGGTFGRERLDDGDDVLGGILGCVAVDGVVLPGPPGGGRRVGLGLAGRAVNGSNGMRPVKIKPSPNNLSIGEDYTRTSNDYLHTDPLSQSLSRTITCY